VSMLSSQAECTTLVSDILLTRQNVCVCLGPAANNAEQCMLL